MIKHPVIKPISMTILYAMTVAWTSFLVAQPGDGAVGDKKPLRELYVPIEEMDILLGSGTKRVFIERQEYLDLLKRAKVEDIQMPPASIAFLHAQHQVSVDGQRANIVSDLKIEVLQDGLQTLHLPLSNAGILSATMDGQPATLVKEENGQVRLIVQGKGIHQVSLNLLSRVFTDAATQTLQFQLPRAVSGEIQIQVPGNVEIRSGVEVIDRRVDEAAGTTHFRIVPTNGPMGINMSLNNRKLRDQSTVLARGVLIAEVTQSYESLFATMSMNVLSGATDEFRFEVDDELEVNSVQCDAMSRWTVEDTEQGRFVVVKLRTPSTGRTVVNARLDRPRMKLESWRLPVFHPAQVAGYSSVIGVFAEDRLSASQIQSQGLVPVDATMLAAALPASFGSTDVNAPKLVPIAAYFAPQSKLNLTLVFSPRPPQVLVTSSLVTTISDRGLGYAGSISLLPTREKLFAVEFYCPADWTIESAQMNGPLQFEKLAITESEAASGIESNLVRIRIPVAGGIAVGQNATVTFAASSIPDTWFQSWTNKAISQSGIKIIGASSHRGTLQWDTVDDMEMEPQSVQGLSVFDTPIAVLSPTGEAINRLSYQFDQEPWTATILVSRKTPVVDAHLVSFFQIKNESLQSHAQINFKVRNARTQQLAFSLPESTPSEIAIKGLGRTSVRESTSQVLNGVRVWNVKLAEKMSGDLSIAIDFSSRLDTTQNRQLDLPIARAYQVAFQSGSVAIEGTPELQIEIQQHPRPIDVGELVDAEYVAGKRVLGVYGYVGTQDATTVRISRSGIHELPRTIVQRAEMVSLLSNSGRCQTVVRMQVRTSASYLEIQLPEKSELWSAQVDSLASLPQREGASLLLPLPKQPPFQVRNIQLVYETEIAKLLFRTRVEVPSPRYFERSDNRSTSQPIPVADCKWDWVLPTGYTVANAGGTLPTEPKYQPVIEWLGGRLTQLGNNAFAATTSRSKRVDHRYYSNNLDVPATLDFSAQQPSVEKQNMALGSIAEAAGAEVSEQPSDLSGLQAVPSGTTPSTTMPPSPIAMQPTSGDKASRLWALEGIRSLAIDFDRGSQFFAMTSLGEKPTAEVVLFDQERLNWLAVLVACLTLLLGWLWLPNDWSTIAKYCIAIGALAFAMPLLTGWELELDPIKWSILISIAGIAAIKLAIHGYQLWTNTRRNTSPVPEASKVGTLSGITTPLLLLVLLMGSTAGQNTLAQTISGSMPGQIIDNTDQLRMLLKSFDDKAPLQVADDTIIVPYLQDPSESPKGNPKVLIPLSIYERLMRDAKQLSSPTNAPKTKESYAWMGSNYTGTLAGNDSIQIRGVLEFEQFSDEVVQIPLILNNCIVQSAMVDGQPARLQKVEVRTDQQDHANANLPQHPSLYVLYVSGKSKKRLELQLLWKINRFSGWSNIQGGLPPTPASQFELTVPKRSTEVKLIGFVDRESYETLVDGEKIITTLGNDGQMAIQWRERITQTAIEPGLSITANSVFDVQEDSLKLAWNGTFEFRSGARETFTLLVPKEYLIEKVVGPNIRGWSTRPSADATRLQLDVELLKAAEGRESFSIFSSRQIALELGKEHEVIVPQLSVPEAMLHQGRVSIRRSQLMDVRTTTQELVSRMDAVDEASWMSGHEEVGVMPIRFYQAFRFAQVPFQIRLAVSTLAGRLTAEQRTVFRVTQRMRSIETQINLTPDARPLYQVQIALPLGWDIQAPITSLAHHWSIQRTDQNQIVTMMFPNGPKTAFAVVLKANLSVSVQDNEVVPIPEIAVLSADRQQGWLVVQADPAYAIRLEDLSGCEPALMASVQSWLDEAQRASVGAIVRIESIPYRGAIRAIAKTPVINSVTLTNVKVTDRRIEDTVLIQSKIESTGIRQFDFQIPGWMSNATILAPKLQRKSIVPINTQVGAPLRVSLTLQEALMGDFRVVVTQDRELVNGPIEVPLPQIETGGTTRQIVSFENSGRDELVVAPSSSFEKIDPSTIAPLFPGQNLSRLMSELYQRRENAAPAPLTFQTRTRQTIETSGARIGFAATLFVMDLNGTYRATQSLQIENRTEAFLEVELPSDSQLWTVHVDGEPIKPIEASTATAKRVRIPLIKTAAGDLDYPVVLKYGGKCKKPGRLNTINIPLLKTININVEQSQVRLRLPESFHWMRFGGTLGQVTDEAQLQAGWLSYRTRQVTALTELFARSSTNDSYAQTRAANNFLALKDSLERERVELGRHASNEDLSKEWTKNSGAIEMAKKRVESFNSTVVPGDLQGNREALLNLYNVQSNGRAYNVLGELSSNFPDSANQNGPIQSVTESPNGWFSQNSLGKDPEPKAANRLQWDANHDELAQLPQILPAKPAEAQTEERIATEIESANNQVFRYGQRLRSRGMDAGQNANGPYGGGGGMGGMGRGGKQNANADAKGFGSVASQPQAAAGPENSSTMDNASPLPQQPPTPQRGTLNDGLASDRFAASTAAEGFMASLDVDLPVRGQEFYFMTPRGELELTAQGYSQAEFNRLVNLTGILVLAVILWFLNAAIKRATSQPAV